MGPGPGVKGYAATGIVLVGKAYATTYNTGQLTLSLNGTLAGGVASSPSQGDLIIGIAGCSSYLDAPLSLSGNQSGSYTEHCDLFTDGSRDSNLGIYSKFAGATPDTTITSAGNQTGSDNHKSLLGAIVLRNVHADILDVAIATATGTGTYKANPPSVSPASSGSWILPIGLGTHVRTGGPSQQPTMSGIDTLLYGYSYQEVEAEYILSLLVGKVEWVSGALDAPAWTCSDADHANNSWCAATLVIKKA
jgi:hypothetical protein